MNIEECKKKLKQIFINRRKEINQKTNKFFQKINDIESKEIEKNKSKNNFTNEEISIYFKYLKHPLLKKQYLFIKEETYKEYSNNIELEYEVIENFCEDINGVDYREKNKLQNKFKDFIKFLTK